MPIRTEELTRLGKLVSANEQTESAILARQTGGNRQDVRESLHRAQRDSIGRGAPFFGAAAEDLCVFEAESANGFAQECGFLALRFDERQLGMRK